MSMDGMKSFKLEAGFMGRYEMLINEVVIPYQEKALQDEIEDAEKSHAIENFRIAAQLLETGKTDKNFYGMVFQDSDVGKWLEAAAYSLYKNPNKELEKRCDAVIDLIGRAQHKDGYLNTYFTVKEPDKRWTNLEEAHELYCAGHLIEGAVAYAQCTGKDKFLKIMCRMADHIYDRFIGKGEEGYPGHPEIELALMKLFHHTQENQYKELAEHFVNVRGVDSDFFIKESEKFPWTVWGNNSKDKEYTQNHMPVRLQTEAVGHAVRAVYLYTGMADVALETGDETLIQACKTLWENITQKRMYVTGGIGSAYEGEAFTKDYHLPNDTAYAETCASIGLIFFARKMIDLEKKSIYADEMERALYNCVLAGMQLDGTKFFYVNPLEVIPGISGQAKTHMHALPERPKWFACACCPPNVARLLSSIGRYAWSEEGRLVYSHLYLAGTLELKGEIGGSIKVTTEYPYDHQVKYTFLPAEQEMDMTLCIRIPAWSDHTQISLNQKHVECEIKEGYAYIRHCFQAEDEVIVTFQMGVKRIYPSVKVASNSGKVAFSRGPLIYCAEGIDHDGDVLGLRIGKNTKWQEIASDELRGIVKIKGAGYRVSDTERLYSDTKPQISPQEVTLIPYYAWGNRGLNQMRVWLPEIE